MTQVVIDPIDDKVTHLIVEPEHREGLGRLVPIESVDPRRDEVVLRYTRAEFDQLEMAESVRFLPGVEGSSPYDPEQTLLWPHFGGNTTVPTTVDALPVGEVAVRRGERVRSVDGEIGEVEGLIIDTQSHRVTHVVLKEGHVFARRDVALPIAAVESVDDDGIRVSMSKSEIDELPDIDFRRSGH